MSKRLHALMRGVFAGPRAVFKKRLAGRLVQGAPTPQSAVDVFRGAWASELPLPGVASGASRLFDDERIRWFLDRIGGVDGQTVLELGPLEGGHTYMLDRAGAASVVAVEANSAAWLKCLAVKELLQIPSASFLLGDFMDYLRAPGPRFDACVACGVLYHLKDPHTLFPLLRARSDGPVFVWSAVWSDAIPRRNRLLAARFTGSRKVTLATGREITLHRHDYGLSSLLPTFWGGNASHSEWMSKDDLAAAAEAGGYKVREVAFDEPDHVNSPAAAFLLEPASTAGA